jgi:hypothetical protein
VENGLALKTLLSSTRFAVRVTKPMIRWPAVSAHVAHGGGYPP